MKGIPSTCGHFFLLLIMFKIVSPQTNNNPTPPNINQTVPIKCQKTQYTSIFTMCTLAFDYCNASKFTLLSCYKSSCQRYIQIDQCKLWNYIQMDEGQCYDYCCGASTFNQVSCDQYNAAVQTKQNSIDSVIIAIIVVSAVLLVSVAAYLLIKVQKCCDKKEVRKLPKYNINWRFQKIQNSTCQICNSYNALIQTPCQHFFHLSCFEENTKQKHVPLCPKCEQPIKQRIKIGCMGCKEKFFKIKLWKVQQLAQIMQEARALHEEVCTNSTKSDQLLISPIKL